MTDPDSDTTLDLHLTVLFGWLVRTVGAALAWIVGAPAVGYGVALFVSDPAPLALGWIVGAVGLIVTLWSASAPLPYDMRGDE
jgi:hypothetical protein